VPRQAELSETAARTEPVDVIVGIVADDDRRILVGKRPAGKHMAGAWEFPGGKLESGEAPRAGLERELAEELGIIVTGAEPLTEQLYRYPDLTVRLDVWWVLTYEGHVRAREGQDLCWVRAEALAGIDMLPADAPIVAAVRARLAAA